MGRVGRGTMVEILVPLRPLPPTLVRFAAQALKGRGRVLSLTNPTYMIFASNGGTKSGVSNSTTQRSGSNRICRAT